MSEEDMLKLEAAISSNDNVAVATLLRQSGLHATERNYEPLLYTIPPTHIKVADTLPIEEGCNVRSLTLDEFTKQENIQYTAGIYVDRKLRDYFWQCKKDYPRTPINAINHFLTHPRNDLVVAPMGAGLGKGLFLAMDAKTICAGQIVLMYEGILDTDRKEVLDKELAYVYNYDQPKIDNPITHYIKKEFQESGYAIYAGQRGGLARYMQCGVGAFELFYKMDGLTESEKQHIPTVNLCQRMIEHAGCPVVVFVALRNIMPGEELSFAYGPAYWQQPSNAHTARKLCDSYGRVIGEVKNNHIIIANKDHLTSLPTDKNLGKAGLDRIAKEGLLPDPVTYSFDYKEDFLNYLQFSIQSHLNRNKNNTGIYTFIQTLATAAKQSDSNKAYLDVKKILDDEDSYSAFSDSIKPLKKEIIYHAKIYNGFTQLEKANNNNNAQNCKKS